MSAILLLLLLLLILLLLMMMMMSQEVGIVTKAVGSFLSYKTSNPQSLAEHMAVWFRNYHSQLPLQLDMAM